MDGQAKQRFVDLWDRYFPGAELPIAFFYTEVETGAPLVEPTPEHRCFIGDLARVRAGRPLRFDVNSLGCGGAKRYLGYTRELAPNFEFFLSCGIPGELEGERYKKTPELVKQLLSEAPDFVAPAKYIVFKRWDMLDGTDEPEVIVFFATPDVLSGLFTLSGFDEAAVEAVIAPFAAGCGSIVQYPYLELSRDRPRAVLGMFDVSARPYVPAGMLTFAVPRPKFDTMVADAEESFLITESWAKVRRRIAGGE